MNSLALVCRYFINGSRFDGDERKVSKKSIKNYFEYTGCSLGQFRAGSSYKIFRRVPPDEIRVFKKLQEITKKNGSGYI